MPRPTGTLAILLVALGLSGCAAVSTNVAYPVVDDGPNPAPVRGYRVRCHTGPSSPDLLDVATLTGCEQVIPPEQTGLRTRG